MYMNAVGEGLNAALRARPGQLGQPAAPAITIDAPVASPSPGAPVQSEPTGVVVPPITTPDNPDIAPASAPPKSKTPPPPENSSKSNPPPTNEGVKERE